jgi:hypothetical protein
VTGVVNRLHVVTGAPGAGKSTALTAFLGLRTGRPAFDVDWLTGPASDLCGRSVVSDAGTWPAFHRMWFEVLHGVRLNGLVPVFFAALDAGDVLAAGLPASCDGVSWLLLDCADDIRRGRLAARHWPEEEIAGAVADAARLREEVPERLDTGLLSPGDVAGGVAGWLRDA